jgi:Gnt-I system low-affinity gluconate transporter
MLEKTFIMMAIAAGSIVLSHVNDSGFWLVNRMLNQSVQQTLKSWTILSTVISVTSFALIFIAYQLV